MRLWKKQWKWLAVSVVFAASIALPAVASANPSHIDKAEAFTIADQSTWTLETTTGEKIECHSGVTGSGTFENTTTGTLNVKFHNCTTVVFGFTVACSTSGEPSGTIATTTLPFHLVMLGATSPGVLVTPNSSGAFAHFACGGVNKTVTGNGVLGTLVSPNCGTASSTATITFEHSASTGIQKHTTYTGVNYHLEMGGNKASLQGVATTHFPSPRTVNCTF